MIPMNRSSEPHFSACFEINGYKDDAGAALCLAAADTETVWLQKAKGGGTSTDELDVHLQYKHRHGRPLIVALPWTWFSATHSHSLFTFFSSLVRFSTSPKMRGQVIFAFVAQVAAYTDIDVDMFMYKNIDPIVFPGEYGKSHLHTFFGSDAITAATTTSAELQAGCATAENPNDFSTYCESSHVRT